MLARINRQEILSLGACDFLCSQGYVEGMANFSYKDIMTAIRNEADSFAKQEDCADAWKIPQSTVSKIKKGKDITFKTACGILEKMGMNLVTDKEIEELSKNDEHSVRIKVLSEVTVATSYLGIDGEKRSIINDVISGLKNPREIMDKCQNQRAAGE